MERRTTLAASVTATLTLAFGTMAYASLGGVALFGFGDEANASANSVVTETAPTTPPAAPVVAETTLPVDAAAAPETSAPATAAPVAHAASRGTAAATTMPTTARATSTTTKAAVTTTTVKATTTTVKAPTTTVAPAATVVPVTTVKAQLYTVTGQTIPSTFSVPTAWRTKPIPAYPAGCKAGQLEDNGVWNCQ